MPGAAEGTWSRTRLWKLLEDRNEPLLARLSIHLEKAETVLASGGTAPLDFTLHDQGHSYRVANRIFELMPSPSALSSFEAALLLLSAYVHDIGMAAPREFIERHRDYTLSQDPELLSTEELSGYRRWLDETGSTLPALAMGHRYIGEKADELITYYLRYRHNDLGEAWARLNLSNPDLQIYSQWLEDLVALL